MFWLPTEREFLTDLSPSWALHAHYSGACGKSTSVVRCKGIPGRCLRLHTPVRCSCPFENHPCNCSGRDTSHRRPSWCRHTELPDPEKKRRDGHRCRGVL